MIDTNESNIKTQGNVISVQGPVVDVKFSSQDQVPEIFEKVFIEKVDKEKLILEVAEHLPGNVARCIAINSTINIKRNSPAYVLTVPIQIPVGENHYGRLINVLGEPMDQQGSIEAIEYMTIRKSEMGTKVSLKEKAKTEILETGIKMIDL